VSPSGLASTVSKEKRLRLSAAFFLFWLGNGFHTSAWALGENGVETKDVVRLTRFLESEPFSTAAPHDDRYRHKWSGMRFPDRVGHFVRTGMREYDAAASDISATYSLDAEDVSAVGTVYIYPLTDFHRENTQTNLDAIAQSMLCSQELEKRKQELMKFHPDIVLNRAQPFSVTQGRTTRDGVHISFNDVDAYGGVPQNVSSDFYLFCFVSDMWTVAYRFTYPAKRDVNQYILPFMQELSWPQPHESGSKDAANNRE
jgi:hypothetical protein